MVVSSDISSGHMLYVTDDVIDKTRNELVYTGELEETVLNQIEAIWKTKMLQAGIINGTIERSPSPIPEPTHVQIQDKKPFQKIADKAQFPRSMNLSMDHVDSVKIERDGFFIHQRDGFLISQQDGANDEDDEDDELLNLDDDEEVAAVDEDDEDIPHLVMCQFNNVKRTKNKWDCKFKSGIMKINGKNILFSKADGVFEF
ncbi:hypothetical protein AALP_AA8G382000 [Arabis alpina]|uniref:Transcription initiation factor IIA subunit 1 n=1 Tax=Arabis alpina TaxID=50452 RepID=A0A087GC33_ARAAL|nr:hypothetical protein AALP_AA8G382000 [Arabis alpina]